VGQAGVADTRRHVHADLACTVAASGAPRIISTFPPSAAIPKPKADASSACSMLSVAHCSTVGRTLLPIDSASAWIAHRSNTSRARAVRRLGPGRSRANKAQRSSAHAQAIETANAESVVSRGSSLQITLVQNGASKLVTTAR